MADHTAIDVFTALETARAIRHLAPEPLPRPLIERLVYYATRASNPGNSQLWSFVVVDEPEKKRHIAQAVRAVMGPAMAGRRAATAAEARMYTGAAHLVSHLENVPVLIFVCAKNGYPPGRPDPRFVWSAVYPASQNLILAARGLGLGATFTTFHMVAEARVREVLRLPEDVLIGTTMCVGYPERAFGPVARMPVAEVLHWNGWLPR